MHKIIVGQISAQPYILIKTRPKLNQYTIINPRAEKNLENYNIYDKKDLWLPTEKKKNKTQINTRVFRKPSRKLYVLFAYKISI